MNIDARLVANFAAFQLAWFACVVAAGRGHALLGTGAIALAVALHAWLSRRARPELALVGIAVAIGAVWESVVVATGFVAYPSGMLATALAPYWIVAMWALFATTLNATLVWLRGRYVLAAAFGAIGGPLSYLAGIRLGAVEAIDVGSVLILQGIGWGMVMPLLMYIAPRFDGFQRGVRASGAASLREASQHV